MLCAGTWQERHGQLQRVYFSPFADAESFYFVFLFQQQKIPARNWLVSTK